jgi:murein L,D-transpeptidase YcbB/YkuD
MIRGGRCVASAIAAGLLLSTPVLAQESGTPATGSESAEATPLVPAEPTLAMKAAARGADIGRRTGAHADDIAALRAHYAANPDKVLWIEGGALNSRARAVIEEIGKSDDWGLRASAFRLPSGDAATDPVEAEALLTLAVLAYARHARGGRMDPTQLTESIDRTANLLSPAKVLADSAAAPAADEHLRKLHPQHPQFERLRRLYLDLRVGRIETSAPAPEPEVRETIVRDRRGRKRKKVVVVKPKAPPPLTAEKVLFNMEQWRWMPDDLGRLHVDVNVPEFQFRVVKDGTTIHTERVVVGTYEMQTPIFSKEMQTVVFQPGWGIPPTIKVKQLLPGLLAGRDTVSSRGYVMSHRGRQVSPLSVDWRSVDIRRVSIVQPPGPSNALGQVKFMFPNKHDVYMHDTPARSLFNSEVRTYSNGCVRVRNPMRFAEIIFAETAGWSPTRVASAARGRPENEVRVSGKLDVHLTYFTVVVGDDGKVQTFRDVYGHEPRVLGALDGQLSQVAKKPRDLNAVRTALVSQSGARRARQERREAAPRQGPGPRAYAAPRSSGGGFFSWLGN